MSPQLMRPEIVGPIQIIHDDGVRACENNTGIWVFIIGCVILPAVFFRMDEGGIEKLPEKYYWLIVFRLGESLCRTLAVGHVTLD